MSSFSDYFEAVTSSAESVSEVSTNPTDSLMFKAVFTLLYSVVFCLCFAGQLRILLALLQHN